ncbi:MAG: Glucose sorbosone dehydrogenase [Promethearchaeota archaeon]|nr:MAG: Glucose sorbosone dehydrogenase [Candidatus Lokiarchaeota archaeon]
MKNKFIALIVIIVVIIAGVGIFILFNQDIIQNGDTEYEVERVFEDLNFAQPVGLYDPDDGTNRLFVLEQKGNIYVFENEKTTSERTLFLDITDQVTFGGEMGLLGLAFHPNYAENGYFYVDYINTDRDTIISRFEVNDGDINKAEKESEKVILTVEQPFDNHNGGQLAFGPDGYLYIALGDGGSGGDPQGNGQNRKTLLGSILRIDIDSGDPYGIPDSNPFVGNTEGYREEIFAYGLRNPWRFSFDTETGELWTGDVGQNAWEEIDIIESGKNYGWAIMEGMHCYQSNDCDQTGLTLPIYEYDHSVGRSITGGFVYRGETLSNLEGKYIYADYVVGKIWALSYEGNTAKDNQLLVEVDQAIPSFGVDRNNNLYFLSFDGYVYQIVEK